MYLETQTTIYKWLFQLDDSKLLHEKRVFHQTIVSKWLLRVLGIWYIYIYIHLFISFCQSGRSSFCIIPARDLWQVGVLTADKLTCSSSTTAMSGGCDITLSPKSSRKMINCQQKFFLWKHKIKGTVVSQNRRCWANIDLEVSWKSIANCISYSLSWYLMLSKHHVEAQIISSHWDFTVPVQVLVQPVRGCPEHGCTVPGLCWLAHPVPYVVLKTDAGMLTVAAC